MISFPLQVKKIFLILVVLLWALHLPQCELAMYNCRNPIKSCSFLICKLTAALETATECTCACISMSLLSGLLRRNTSPGAMSILGPDQDCKHHPLGKRQTY